MAVQLVCSRDESELSRILNEVQVKLDEDLKMLLDGHFGDLRDELSTTLNGTCDAPKGSLMEIDPVSPSSCGQLQDNHVHENYKVPARTASRSMEQLEKLATKRVSTVHDPKKYQVRSFVSLATSVTKSSFFDVAIAGLVTLNAVGIGIAAEYAVQNPGKEAGPEFTAYDTVFAACFFFELVLRMLAQGLSFWSCYNDDVSWNYFDLLLVMSALCDLILAWLSVEFVDVSAARMMRLLKLVRIIRIIRIFRFFKDLRIMVDGVMCSLKPLCWALVLLFVIMYLFAVAFMQILADYLATQKKQEGTLVASNDVTIHFGSLVRSIYTLFLCISGGRSWYEVAEPLIQVSPILAGSICLYVAFSEFCVLNIVTGIFVENASKMCQYDEEMMILNEIEERKHWVKEIKNLFISCDMDGSGEMTQEEFGKQVQDVRLQMWLKNLGINMLSTDHNALFSMFDYDDSGTVGIDEFADGLMRFHGNARSFDLAEMNVTMMKEFHKLNAILSDATKTLDESARLARFRVQQAKAPVVGAAEHQAPVETFTSATSQFEMSRV